MAINLSKGSSINLSKIELKKSSSLTKLCVGLNWGTISKKTFFGLLNSKENVDLDGSVALFNKTNKLLEVVFFNRLFLKNNVIIHSGDDGLDNEIISINFKKIPMNVHTIVLFLNSYKEQDFTIIPYSKIRIFEGTKRKVENELAFFNLSKDKDFSNYTSMIMAKIINTPNGWEFKVIGEPSKTSRVSETVEEIKQKYL